MKKILSIVLSVILLVGSIGVFAQEKTDFFVDVPESHWAYDAIRYFYHANVVNGVASDTFAPEKFVTREQFAKLLSIIYNKTEYQTEEQTFSDVSKNVWSFGYIESVKEYLTGYYPQGGAPFFNPGAKAAREDIAYALVKISNLDSDAAYDESALSQFKDNGEISPKLRKYVAIAVAEGLMQGDGEGLRPQDGITRAETVTLLFRAMKQPIEEQEGQPEENENPTEEKEQKDDESTDGALSKWEYRIVTKDIKRVSGYSEDEIKGEINACWSPKGEESKFAAKVKCNNGDFGNMWVACEISLTEFISCTETEIEGYFQVLMDGEIRHERLKGKVSVQNGILKWNTEEYDYNLMAVYGNKEEAKKEEEEKKKPAKGQEPIEELLYDSKGIVLDVKKLNSQTASGMFLVEYNEQEQLARVIADITVGDDIYHIKLVEADEISDSQISGTFTIICNGNIIAENESGRVTEMDAGLAKTATFTTNEAAWRVEGMIVEIMR